MQAILGYAFLFYFASAFFAARGRAYWFAAGLASLGLNSLLWVVVRQSRGTILGSYESLEFISGSLYLAGLVCIVVGSYRFSVNNQGLLRTVAPPKPALGTEVETPMESLVIPRNDSNSFSRGILFRDRLYEAIEAICRANGTKVIGYKSHNASGLLWVRFDYDLPQDRDSLTLRASLKVTVDRMDFHRFEHILTLETTRGTRTKTVHGLVELLKEDIGALDEYLARGGAYPRLRSRRVQTNGLQFWRPANRVAEIGKDWVVICAVIGFIVGFLLFGIAPPVGVLVFLSAVVFLGWFMYQRKTYVLTTGKPQYDPRIHLRMDSWQSTIPGLGTRRREVRDAIYRRLASAKERGVKIVVEKIWYPGVDGKVERRQIVSTYRRAIGYLHVEAYGDDLYVGWDTHVNAGTWVEQTIARGIDKRSGVYVVANRVVPGSQIPNEFDITDTNFLTEWIHATVVKIIRLKMEEHKIDEQIDFTVHRESRNEVFAAMQTGDSNKNKSEGTRTGNQFFSRLRRVE
jgi:hypothetical protein